jgi:hypothetical protein
MKNQFHFCVRAAALAAAAVLFSGTATHAAPPKKPAPAPAPTAHMAESNAPSSEPPQVPQSVFTIPRNPKEGRDPFYPNSDRLFNPPKPKSTSAGAEALVLNGLSGTARGRLAMINGKTLAEGEETEVATSEGRLRIRCLQIKTDSVVIESAGQRRELRLRQNY